MRCSSAPRTRSGLAAQFQGKMNDYGLRRAALGSLIFFCLAPGAVAGLVPYLISGWRPITELPILVRLYGAALVALGVLSLIDSFVRFVVHGRGTPAPMAAPKRLVVSGQYRYVRNPMYVALVLVVAGQALWFGSVLLVFYALALWALFHVRVLTYEEPHLLGLFGAEFDDYRRNVRRWVPRMVPWHAGDEGPSRGGE